MKKLSKRERYLVLATLIFAILALFIYYYYFPLKNEIESLKFQSEDLSSQIEEAKNTRILIDTSKKEIEDLNVQILESRDFLMDSIDEPALIKYINDIASGDSNLESINYNQLLDNEIYFTKDINIRLDTDYLNLKKILREFEEGENFTTLHNFTIFINNQTSTTEITNEDGQVEVVEIPGNTMPLTIDMLIRFYGVEGTWDGTGEYDFMKSGRFSKPNLFK